MNERLKAPSGRVLLPLLISSLSLWGCTGSSTSGSGTGKGAPKDAVPVASPFRVVSASVDGPVKAGTRATAGAGCPEGTVLVGGGVNTDLKTGKPPSPSIRVHGTFPRATSGAPAAGSRPASWAAAGATGGQDEKDGRTTSFVICTAKPDSAPAASGAAAPGTAAAGAASATVRAPADALVAVATAAGPTKAGSSAKATATCPTGMGLTGGGGDVTMKDGSAPPRHYFVAGSYPSTTKGSPASAGNAVTSWTTVGAIGGMPLEDGSVNAFAVCANGASTTVATTSVKGPSEPRDAAVATVGCPVGTALVSGGANAGLPKGGNPPQGLHLRGSFPSTAKGAASSSGATPEAWTAIGNAGGMLVLGASTTAYALCAK